MSVNKHDAASYWKANIRIIMVCMVIWALCSYGFGIVFRPLLAGIHIGGTDLGFWFAQQGSILTFIGIIFFSGSLYVLALSGTKWLGAVTPLGGAFFIIAWLLTAVAAWRAH